MTRDDATLRQHEAARPDASTWLSANAGSGKTRVLTDRVARLLLGGTRPTHILCLTYTKAAATEMQNRLFKRLGEWAMLEDDDLRAKLRELGLDDAMPRDALREARTLFARAIETPGGLRIQTIHSFCASLLRRFPLEAGVALNFTEIEDRAADQLRLEILDVMSEGADAPLVEAIAPYIPEAAPGAMSPLTTLMREVIGNREAIAGMKLAGVWAQYDERVGTTPADLAKQSLGTDTLAILRDAIAPLRATGVKSNETLAAGLEHALASDGSSIDPYVAPLLTKGGEVRKSFFTTALTKADPVLAGQLQEALDSLATAFERLKAIKAAARDVALMQFGQRFITRYEAEKQRRGWLDFDDLISKARDLLSDEQVADWVLYRLDGGIDHILVDEAQDTSPRQWDVIEKLSRELTSGQGARDDVRRTIFVVGDKKQSIYSFQGADPREFDRMRDIYKERLSTTDSPLNPLELQYSFRSSSAILGVVDATFRDKSEAGFLPEQSHIAFKDTLPGRVDLWPVVPKAESPPASEWDDPVDRTAPHDTEVVLARRIARFLRHNIDAGTLIADEVDGQMVKRPMRPGDVLILLRRRKKLFQEIIRACKQEHLAIAGADQLVLMAELAVRDVVALLSFLATPEDDLALAASLRSPLFGLSEQQLFTLAHGRGKKYLWNVLRDREDVHPQVLSVLHDLRGKTDFLRPFDLIDRILTHHGGRQRLIGRLGVEAEDGLNALQQQALAYEQSDIPSLTGFLEWIRADDLKIKRAPEQAGDRIRVMTMHGAKGLEAPVVILPECHDPSTDVRRQLLPARDGVMWKLTKAEQPPAQRAAIEDIQRSDMRERERLLYVGMTRAEKWLIVAAGGAVTKEDAWYNRVHGGMVHSEAVPFELDIGDGATLEGLRLETGALESLPLVSEPPQTESNVDLPDYLKVPAGDVVSKPLVAASNLGGAKALAGEAGDETDVAMARGTAVHLLLEQLATVPDEMRETVAQNVELELLPPLSRAEITAEALRSLRAPHLSHVFGSDALVEVPITADLRGLGRLSGVIDRLVINDRSVLAVDFKTNRVVPGRASDVPEGVLRQLGAYADALQQIYPDKTVETAILWTADTTYMKVPHDLVTQALARAVTS